MVRGLFHLLVWYLHIGMKPDSPAQPPEGLFRETSFLVFVLVLSAFVGA
jgi:hypothetical protein